MQVQLKHTISLP